MITFLVLMSIIGYSRNQGPTSLFDSEQILHIRLSGNIHELMQDRSADERYHEMTMSYKNGDSNLMRVPVRVKTRGHFRRTPGVCTYPPLLLNFSKNKTANSIFHNQDKMKLVTPCAGDKYVVREYLAYKMYNLITPRSFRARLVKIVFDDTVKQTKSQGLFGILLEEEDQMAHRNSSYIFDRKALKPEQTQADDFLKMAVFQYMIGNTDWSVPYFQNIKLIATDSLSLPSTVPYDFDHSGIVSAPYAKPAEALKLSSVHERRYRGYCMPGLHSFESTFALFNLQRENIYSVITSCPYPDEGYIKATVKYLDSFYRTINDPKSGASEFGYPCNKQGTGNVVIKGLKKN